MISSAMSASWQGELRVRRRRRSVEPGGGVVTPSQARRAVTHACQRCRPASRPNWARIVSAEPCGMNLAGMPSTCTGTAGVDRVHLIGDGHADATVADAVLDGDDGAVARPRRRSSPGRAARSERTSHTVASTPASASVSAAFAPRPRILPMARMHTEPSAACAHRAGEQPDADLVLADLAGRAPRPADRHRAVVGERRSRRAA